MYVDMLKKYAVFKKCICVSREKNISCIYSPLKRKIHGPDTGCNKICY